MATLDSGKNSKSVELLQELKRLAEKTVSSARDISLLLRPSMLDDLGLVPALRWQARELSRTQSIPIQVLADEMPETMFSEEQKVCIYRIVQEALKNAVRHAKASAIVIRFSEVEENFVLHVDDNGRGFTPSQERGLGILGMEERVHHLKGTLEVRSQPGQGTSVRVRLPLFATAVRG